LSKRGYPPERICPALPRAGFEQITLSNHSGSRVMQKQFLGAISALLAIVTLAGAQPARRTKLETLVVSRETGSRISIEITTNDETTPWVETLENPARIVVDLPNTVLAAGLGPIPILTNGVKGIRVGTDAARTTRVVVDLARLCRYELVPGGGHHLILRLDPTAPAPELASSGGVQGTRGVPVQSAFVSSPASAPSQSPPSPPAPKEVVTSDPASKADPAAIAVPANAAVQPSTEVAVTRPSSAAVPGQPNIAQPVPATDPPAASATSTVVSSAPAGATAGRANTAPPPAVGVTTESAGAPARVAMGGHMGVLLPLITRSGGTNTTIADSFSIGFPMGFNIHGAGRMAFDMEFVPLIQDSPRQVSLTFHPGLIWALGHRYSFGMRAAFVAGSSEFGFTPLLNKSWPIEGSFFKAYFVEADFPVRFNRPAGQPATDPVTFGLHFGLGF
jgi:hypothetical protein